MQWFLCICLRKWTENEDGPQIKTLVFSSTYENRTKQCLEIKKKSHWCERPLFPFSSDCGSESKELVSSLQIGLDMKLNVGSWILVLASLLERSLILDKHSAWCLIVSSLPVEIAFFCKHFWGPHCVLGCMVPILMGEAVFSSHSSLRRWCKLRLREVSKSVKMCQPAQSWGEHRGACCLAALPCCGLQWRLSAGGFLKNGEFQLMWRECSFSLVEKYYQPWGEW